MLLNDLFKVDVMARNFRYPSLINLMIMGKPITFCKRVNISELYIYLILTFTSYFRGCHGRDRMVVGFQTAYAISAYHH
jgi:hypothetical protein